MNVFSKMRIIVSGLLFEFFVSLPDELSKFRVMYYNKIGCVIHKNVAISPNVRIRGRFEIGEGSSIAQNCSISGECVGVFVGKNVMIAPNVVIVTFNHGFESLEIDMAKQINTVATVIIEDNVWIGANCSIAKGVKIGTGAIIGANSFVNKDVMPYSIMGGVPAKLIRNRKIND